MVTDSGGFDDRGLSFHFPLVVLPPGGVTCSFSLLIILRRLRIPTLYHNLIRERKSLSDGGGITRSVHSRACTEDGRELPRQKSGLRTFAASCLASGTNSKAQPAQSNSGGVAEPETRISVGDCLNKEPPKNKRLSYSANARSGMSGMQSLTYTRSGQIDCLCAITRVIAYFQEAPTEAQSCRRKGDIDGTTLRGTKK